MAATVSPSATRWWGKFELGQGELGHWRIGPLDLWVRRTALDWRYGATRGADGQDGALEVQVPAPAGGAEAELPEEQARFGFPKTEAELELVPLLADRAVVARPSVPFFVPSGKTVELFVSTPLWIRLSAGRTSLAELPCTRPSDTWFGTNTRGALSYATRTHLRRSVEEVPVRAHRALSCVTVENASKKILALERLSLPVPQLSLFASPSGTLWTERVLLKHEDEGELAEVSLGQGPPAMAGEGEKVSPPRASQGRSFGSLVFGGLFQTGI